MSEFELDDLRQILKQCPEYAPRHHLGRPFMSAYQIAIRFAEAHPQHRQVRQRDVGGKGKGPEHSLAQRIARFLSAAVKYNRAPDIEGGFLSHELIGDMWFNNGGEKVAPSGSNAHSIFRYAPPVA